MPSYIKAPWNSELLKLVEKNVVVPEKLVKGILELTCFEPNGIEVIKKALIQAEKNGAEVIYAGSGKYQIKVVASDYKSAEKKLKDSVDQAQEIVIKAKGITEFKRTEKE